MMWVMLIVFVALIGVSVLIGLSLNKRARRVGSRERQQQLNDAKASGAFQHRKSNQP